MKNMILGTVVMLPLLFSPNAALAACPCHDGTAVKEKVCGCDCGCKGQSGCQCAAGQQCETCKCAK